MVKRMADVITRKCSKCKGAIEIDRNNITNVIQFQGKYYHLNCFESMATQKASSNRGKPEQWKDVLENIWEIEAETKKQLEHFFAKDDLNVWLLENYDIVAVPSYFWQLVADLESGKYKNKRCKPISIKNLCDCWKWGQINLEKINVNNKMNHKGPKNDMDRLRYDLAILITKYPLFLKHKDKMAAIESVSNIESKQPKIDYSTLSKSTNSDGDNDILDLMDEVF